MDTERWQHLAELFDQALMLAPSARDAWLDSLRREDAAAAMQLAAMLEADAREQPLLDTPLLAATLPVAGERVGPYHLVRALGHGGMAEVWLAERDDGGFAQTVALKLIRPGFDSRGVRERFLRERQILAALAHPHIARLLDGGTGSNGRPWFALEYVEGETITRHAARLELRARVRLFVTVCRAVQFAHARLVIHRDLKPANILIDAGGVPKLLDFGVAALLSGPSGTAGDSDLTRSSGAAATPEYAAPEQLAGGPVTVACDVYALGLVLYEVLTGTRLTRGTRALPAPSAGAIDPAVRRTLRGDLDTIVRRALAEDPLRRYASVDALGDDLVRYLDGLPVKARPDSVLYRAHKFFRRHWLGAAAIATIIAALAVGLGGAMWESARAERALAQAMAIKQFLLDVFEAAEPGSRADTLVTNRSVVDRAAGELDRALLADPATQAPLLVAVGRVYYKLRQFDRAVAVLTRGIAQLEALGPHADIARAQALLLLGRARYEAGDEAAAEAPTRQAISLARADPAARSLLVDALHDLGDQLGASGRTAEAEDFLSEAEALARAHADVDPLLLPRILSHRAVNFRRQGDLVRAIATGEQAVAIGRERLGEHSHAYADVLGMMGTLYRRAGRLDQAIAAHEGAVAIDRDDFHEFDPAHLSNLANALATRGRYAQAEDLMRAALSYQEARFGPEHERLASYRANLGEILLERGQVEEAVSLLRAAYASVEQHSQPDSSARRYYSLRLANAEAASGHPGEAERLYRDAAASSADAGGLSTVARNARIGLARLALERGRSAEAGRLLAAASRALADDVLEITDHVQLDLLQGRLAASRADLAAARMHTRAALERAQRLGADHPLVALAQFDLAYRDHVAGHSAAGARMRNAAARLHEVWAPRQRERVRVDALLAQVAR